ncbi:MAG: hypothetical protein QNJ97_05635 [Myxococcota bacterium]|nr:hypothetical protein [Myxococcota bacterium]
MKQFAAGIVVASVFWLCALYAQSTGIFTLFDSQVVNIPEEQLTSDDSASTLEGDVKKKRRGRHKRRRRPRRALSDGQRSWETGSGLQGDNLGAPGSRDLEMGRAGGEAQLTEGEIDRGIDRVFGGIERCLVLVPSDAPAKGKVVVGMRIASSGQVTRVNLQGPKVIISGEAGACIRRTVKSIRYPAFDGPDMVAHYPITFE